MNCLGAFFFGFGIGLLAMFMAWESVWFTYSLHKGLPVEDIYEFGDKKDGGSKA